MRDPSCFSGSSIVLFVPSLEVPLSVKAVMKALDGKAPLGRNTVKTDQTPSLCVNLNSARLKLVVKWHAISNSSPSEIEVHAKAN